MDSTYNDNKKEKETIEKEEEKFEEPVESFDENNSMNENKDPLRAEEEEEQKENEQLEDFEDKKEIIKVNFFLIKRRNFLEFKINYYFSFRKKKKKQLKIAFWL